MSLLSSLAIWSILIGSNFLHARSEPCPKETCFPEYNLGCYCRDPPALSPDVINPQYYFYEAGKTTDTESFRLDYMKQDLAGQLKNLPLDLSSGKLCVVTHGFTERHSEMSSITQACLKRGWNAVAVDWSMGAIGPVYDKHKYERAISNLYMVADITAQVLQAMASTKGLTMDRVTLIGFSLGSQLAGFIGKRVPGVGRIIGIDPAGPSFRTVSSKHRLDKTDAEFVVILHCDGDVEGINKEIGTVDYFPNGGKSQSVCAKDLNIECDHLNCRELMTFILNDKCDMKTFQCASQDVWTSGSCFNNMCTSADGCQPLDVESWKQDSGLQGAYYFNTKQFAVDSHTCGQQYQVTLVADNWVNGLIKIRVQDKHDVWSPQPETFQGMNDMIYESQAKRVLVFAHRLDALKKMEIYFEKPRWTLCLFCSTSPTVASLTIEREDGAKYHIAAKFNLKSEKMVYVDLQKV